METKIGETFILEGLAFEVAEAAAGATRASAASAGARGVPFFSPRKITGMNTPCKRYARSAGAAGASG